MRIRSTGSFSLVMGLMVFAFMSTLTATPAHAAATVTSFADIDYWVGTGSNQAALVLDFKDGSDALVWGYRWDSSAVTQEMITAIDTADTNLNIQLLTYSFGSLVDSMTYGARTAGNDILNNIGMYYFIGSSYNTLSPTWDGVSDHVLVNGEWNALTILAYDVNYDTIDQPFADFAAAPAPAVNSAIPEPATASLLALGVIGGVVTLSRRRRK